MVTRASNDRRTWWLLAGVVIGVGLSSLWPAETVQAVATDREERFAIMTCESGLAMPETVFVLDFLTSRLYGATLNQQTRGFTSRYFRMIAGDFQLDPGNKPKYVIIPGRADLTSTRNITAGASVIYIGELNSGRVVAYWFPVRISTQLQPVQSIEPLDFFSFREAVSG